MIRVIMAEWRKLRRPTLFLGTIGAALFFTGLTSIFLYLMIDSERGNSDRGRQVSREVLELAGARIWVCISGWITWCYCTLCIRGTDCAGVHLRNFKKSACAPTWPTSHFGWQINRYETLCTCIGNYLGHREYWDLRCSLWPRQSYDRFMVHHIGLSCNRPNSAQCQHFSNLLWHCWNGVRTALSLTNLINFHRSFMASHN